MTDYTKDIKVGSSVLVSGPDHSLFPMSLVRIKAVFDPKEYIWFEYVGEDYLDEGHEVHTVWSLR